VERSCQRHRSWADAVVCIVPMRAVSALNVNVSPGLETCHLWVLIEKACEQPDQRIAINAKTRIVLVDCFQFLVNVGQVPRNYTRRDAELFGDFGIAEALLDPVDDLTLAAREIEVKAH